MYYDPISPRASRIILYTGIECGIYATIAHFGENILNIKPKQAALYGASRYLVTGAVMPLFGILGAYTGYYAGKNIAKDDISIQAPSAFFSTGAGYVAGTTLGFIPSYGIGMWSGKKIACKYIPPIMPWKSILLLEGIGILSKMTIGYITIMV